MAKRGFPIVPVLLAGGAALAVYALTRKSSPSIPVPAPIKPGDRITVPGLPTTQPGIASTRSRSPYIIAPITPVPPLQPPMLTPEEINRETCLFGGEFITIDDPRYAQIQPPPRIWVTDRYGRQGVCVNPTIGRPI